MNRIFPVAEASRAVHEVNCLMDGQRTCIALVAGTINQVEKYGMSLIRDLSSLFHVVVNPPDSLVVPDEATGEPVALCTLDLKDQWDYVKSLYKVYHNIADLYKWFDDVIIVPERTFAGNIHMHYIVRLNQERLASDIPKLFWRLFNINCANPSNASALKRFNDIKKFMVNVEPVRDEGIIKYLFHKDKKDYETIMGLKVCGKYPFDPLYLHSYIKPDEASFSRDKEPEETVLILRKRITKQN